MTECHNKVKAVVVSKPQEECNLEPVRVCKHVTKMIPQLRAVKECVNVPKEVCGMSKVKPTKVTIPQIQNWCINHDGVGFVPDDTTTEVRSYLILTSLYINTHNILKRCLGTY